MTGVQTCALPISRLCCRCSTAPFVRLRNTGADGLTGPVARGDLGTVQIDISGHQILRDGTEVRVKPKVFELLAFLIRHAGQVVTRDQLLELVWGYDYAGETRTVDVHVHWLRAAIEEDPGHPSLVQTIRGVGYVLRRP